MARIGGICAVCGRRGHRYGTTDRQHDFDAVACVNMLLPELDKAYEKLNHYSGHLFYILCHPEDAREAARKALFDA